MPRARNSSASHAATPGAFRSRSFGSDGALAIRQRIRAPLKLAWPPRRIKKAATPDRSDATASRRVAVKSSARGSPQISPITAERPGHLKPSSIAHSASRASRVSTWMRFWLGSPGGWTRPLSRIAIRSCTHSSGFEVSSCASRNPAHAPSRGWAANSSERVGPGVAGSTILPTISWGLPPSCKTPPPHFVRSPSPRNEDASGVRLPPPRTSERLAATRLTTLVFFFCSCPASHR